MILHKLHMLTAGRFLLLNDLLDREQTHLNYRGRHESVNFHVSN